MQENSINIITFSPIRIPFCLKVGVNEQTEGYYRLLSSLDTFDDSICCPALKKREKEYERLDEDVNDLRIFTWTSKNEDYTVTFHVFSNSIAVVQIQLNNIALTDAKDIEQYVQHTSSKIINENYNNFRILIRNIYANIKSELLLLQPDIPVSADETNGTPKPFWTARTLMFSKNHLQDEKCKTIIKEWLKNTLAPTEADQILEGTRDHSMSWVNYVIVEEHPGDQDFRINAMILAQYFYTTQEICNQSLKAAISEAYMQQQLTQAGNNLQRSRVEARLHQINYHEHLKHLNRAKRQALDEILECWEYERLVKNSKRMVDVCSDKLEEMHKKRQDKNATITDLLLVSLSFFAVFELSLSLTSLSREIMIKPMLGYHDSNTSLFLSYIANIDVDTMISLGLGATVALVLIYRYIKR